MTGVVPGFMIRLGDGADSFAAAGGLACGDGRGLSWRGGSSRERRIQQARALAQLLVVTGRQIRKLPRGRNAFAERFVLTARTEVTDRMLIFGDRHLRAILAEYEAHYNGRRPHRSRQLHPPRPDHSAASPSLERIKRPHLGGLINEYEQVA